MALDYNVLSLGANGVLYEVYQDPTTSGIPGITVTAPALALYVNGTTTKLYTFNGTSQTDWKLTVGGTVDLSNGVSGILPVANGGTGASTAAGARTSLGAAASGANSDITSLTGLTTPLSVPQGGTGSATASGARTNLSAAQSGTNSDITSITGLTTPLSIAQGGTNATSASAAATNLDVVKRAGDTMTGSLTLNADPSAALHAATKQYVDNTAVTGTSSKPAVRVASQQGQNLTLSGLQTIDGVAVTAGQRVLAWQQTNPVQNGIYLAAAGAWTRATDFAAGSTPALNITVFAAEGTQNADRQFVSTYDSTATTVGVDSINFIRISSVTDLTAGLGISIAGNQVSVNEAALTHNNIGGTLAVNKGGTGATTASAARTNLSAAQSGANADITSLSGLTTALSEGQGGTGESTYTAGQILVGETGGGLAKTTIQSGNGITVTNGSGTISVATASQKTIVTGTLNTTNNTVQNINIQAPAAGLNGSYHVKIKAAAVQTGGTTGAAGDGASFEYVGRWSHNAAGVGTLGTLTNVYISRFGATVALTHSLVSNNYTLGVRGDTNRNLSWRYEVQFTPITV